jgi:hypothetical protein
MEDILNNDHLLPAMCLTVFAGLSTAIGGLIAGMAVMAISLLLF